MTIFIHFIFVKVIGPLQRRARPLPSAPGVPCPGRQTDWTRSRTLESSPWTEPVSVPVPKWAPTVSVRSWTGTSTSTSTSGTPVTGRAQLPATPPARPCPCRHPGMVTIKFESELASFQENLNQVSSVSLLMTSSPALANEGLFELTRRPSLTRAVSLSFAKNIK